MCSSMSMLNEGFSVMLGTSSRDSSSPGESWTVDNMKLFVKCPSIPCLSSPLTAVPASWVCWPCAWPAAARCPTPGSRGRTRRWPWRCPGPWIHVPQTLSLWSSQVTWDNLSRPPRRLRWSGPSLPPTAAPRRRPGAPPPPPPSRCGSTGSSLQWPRWDVRIWCSFAIRPMIRRWILQTANFVQTDRWLDI